MGRFGDGDILARTEQYALRAITVYRHLRKMRDEEAWVMGRQLLRSGTSIGANLVEADAAETTKDFIHKCRISLKETRESGYWLRLIVLANIVKADRLADIADETDQLTAIIVSIINNTEGKDEQ